MNELMLFFMVMLAGGCGALCRYGVNEFAVRFISEGFPAGTMLINVSGSFVAGLITGVVFLHPSGYPEWAVIVLLSGFLGGYTTFSTWMLQSIDLLRTQDISAIMLNTGLSVILGAGSAASGFALAGWVM